MDYICDEFRFLFRIIGYIIFGIKFFTPYIIIIVSMIDLIKIMFQKKEEEIKKIRSLLVRKVILGVCVFLVASVVGILMNIVGASEYKECSSCINNPFNCKVPSNQIEHNN